MLDFFRSTIGAGVCLAASSCLAQSAGSVGFELAGIFRSDCAPYDGSAFSVTLHAPGDSREYRLKANAPLSEAVGTWRHSNLSSPNQALIARCETKPEIKCEYPESGTFQIEPLRGDVMRGRVTVQFSGDNRPRRFAFSANATPTKNSGLDLCG